MFFSVEMVLIDAEGGRIQASIRKAMIRKFKNSIVEGGVYKMIYFGLIENCGEYRASFHQFKLLFQPRTRIFPTESEVIPRFGIQAKISEELRETNGKSDYMFDFIGVLTAVGEEKEFKKFGRPIRVLEIELTDDKGVMKCSLFGRFIQMMKDFVANGVDDLGILVIQFAKVKEYMGQISLNTVGNSTRLLWNAQIPEVTSFKN
ncbi:Nucleic acid-binding, OB-fold, partial [Sesbania bispinosa]